MRRIRTPRMPAWLAECRLIAAIAVVTAWAWMYLTGQYTLTVGAVITCTVISVTVCLAVEAAVRHVRRGRPRRAHARTTREEP